MKQKSDSHQGVHELCRRLKIQLDELSVEVEVDQTLSNEEKARRAQLMEQLKLQLSELSR
ncbi:MAG: hypothetical protein ACXWQE_09500 [Bdellovibrionales bacterium]